MSRRKLKGKMRFMVVAYDEYFSYVDIVIIHPMSQSQIKNRVKSGRWIEM